MVDRPRAPGRQARPVHAEVARRARRSRPARSASSSPASRRSTARRSATRSRWTRGRQRAAGGLQAVQPRVFAGLFPVNPRTTRRSATRCKAQAQRLGPALRARSPTALGFGFRCGFLGLLHMDIVQERLEREYNLDLITSAPTVVYEIVHDRRRRDRCRQSGQAAAERTRSRICASRSSRQHPAAARLRRRRDQAVHRKSAACRPRCSYVGNQVSMQYEMPLAEVVLDFFDRLKSVSRGYASFDYEFNRFEAAPLVELDMLINGDKRRCAVDHRPPRQRLSARPRAGRQDAGADPAADVRGRDPGRDRQPRHRARRRSRRCARTCWRSATAATSPASASSWRSRRKARSA